VVPNLLERRVGGVVFAAACGFAVRRDLSVSEDGEAVGELAEGLLSGMSGPRA